MGFENFRPEPDEFSDNGEVEDLREKFDSSKQLAKAILLQDNQDVEGLDELIRKYGKQVLNQKVAELEPKIVNFYERELTEFKQTRVN